jgi:hypothetical protein
VGTLEQRQRGQQHAALEARRMRRAERAPEWKRHPQEARRAVVGSVLAHQADAGGGNALVLDEVCQRAHGARAVRSPQRSSFSARAARPTVG